MIPIYALSLLLFLGPGLWAARVLKSPSGQPQPLLLALATLFGGLAGYAAFVVYLVSPWAGWCLSGVYLTASLLSWIWLLRTQDGWRLLSTPDVALPIFFWLAVGAFYLGALYTVEIGFSADIQARYRFWPVHWGQDDTTPQRLAELLYQGDDPTVPNAEWGMSDRPPLQAGMFLIQRPLSLWTGLGIGGHYLAVAVGFQGCWIPAVWALARLSGLTTRQTLRTLALLAFSGFVFFNSVFVWPKMLAGALGLLTAVPLVSEDRRQSPWVFAMAGVAAGLAWLAHGGVAFTLLALAALYLNPLYWPGWRGLATGLGVFLALALPWAAYQKWFDPPGNKLVKAHLGGQIAAEQSPSESVGQVLMRAYGRLSLSQLVAYKIGNAQTLVGPALPSTVDGWRQAEFGHLVYALGPLWLGCPLLFLTSRRRLWPLLAVGMLSVLFCVLLLYGPGAAHIRHGSYTGYLALFTVAAAALALLPLWAYAVMLAAQAAWCTVVWIISPALATQGRPDAGMILAAGSAGALLLVLAYASPTTVAHELNSVARSQQSRQ
jgi:hypothetical protein